MPFSRTVSTATLRHFRIDDDHSNAFVAWKRAGSPQQPTPEQYLQLEKAGQLTLIGPPETISIKDGKASLRFDVPRQAVSLLTLTW